MSWLIDAIYYVVPFVVLLGIFVFVHEFGHFIVARLCGVAVTEFSIGFGKKLWGFTDRKNTEWKISAIPLGGYCKFLGDDDASSSSGDTSNLSEEDKKVAYGAKNIFRRISFFHFITALYPSPCTVTISKSLHSSHKIVLLYSPLRLSKILPSITPCPMILKLLTSTA